jgi:CRISPR/Cas system endoribonuclease Cas6 (RAMP superfamily)
MTERSEFTVHHLRFEVEALTPLLLPAHAGPSIRGALWGALQRHFCPASQGETPDAVHKALCPVCWLMATDNPGYRTGRDVPRPYAVAPPLADEGGAWRPWRFEPGQRFAFGLTLFAEALNLFPYLVVAMPLMGQGGMGIPLEENGSRAGDRRRGQFALRRIEAVNPLTGAVAAIMGEGQTMVQMPGAPVTAQDVEEAAQALGKELGSDGRVQLCFWTPMRLVEQGKLVKRPRLGPLFRRLLERLDALRGEYAGEPPVIQGERERLVALADGVRLVRDFTQWIDLKSGSRRLGRTTPVGGFVGVATYQATRETWDDLLPYLVWGQEVHVGKSATKGDGWYEVRVAEGG